MFGHGWYRNNTTPLQRLWRAEERLENAKLELAAAERAMADAAAEFSAYSKFHELEK